MKSTITLLLSILLIIASTVTLDAANYQPSGDATAAAGELDATFGNGGKVITDFNGNGDYLNGIAIQPDGKIIAVGSLVRPNQSYFCLARYNHDGTLDSSFGAGGKVAIDVRSEEHTSEL